MFATKGHFLPSKSIIYVYPLRFQRYVGPTQIEMDDYWCKPQLHSPLNSGKYTFFVLMLQAFHACMTPFAINLSKTNGLGKRLVDSKVPKRNTRLLSVHMGHEYSPVLGRTMHVCTNTKMCSPMF